MDQWVDSGMAGNMDYLLRNREKRYDIRQLVPGAQLVIVGLLTYEHSGHDYHRAVKSKLYELERLLFPSLAENIQPEAVPSTQHIFCDSAPVLERSWAVKAGLGWIGLNHQFFHPILGSFVHPGELVLCDTIADYQSPIKMQSLCGSCRKCIEACPNHALGQPVWDARKCVAYVTHKCIVCQEVCPFNHHVN